jgi:uncharacterized coiled-coil DUF342 family protein
MSTSGKTEDPSLVEILEEIKEASKLSFSKDGRTYAKVSPRKLAAWHKLLDDYTDEDAEEIKTLRVQVAELEKAVTAYDDRLAELRQEKEKASSALALLEKNVGKGAETLTKSIEVMKAELADSKSALADTNAQIQALTFKKSTPEAKYDPAVATALQELNEKLELSQKDLQVSIAEIQASIEATRKEAGQKSNQIGKLRKASQSASEELVKFMRAAQFATAALTEKAFDPASFDTLLAIYGRPAAERLRDLSKTTQLDVQERLGIIKKAAVSFKGSLKSFGHGLAQLVSAAFSALRKGTKAVVLKLTPWVNDLVKDIMSVRLKSLKEYRASLEAAVGDILKKTTTVARKAHQKQRENFKHSWNAILKMIAKARKSFWAKAWAKVNALFAKSKDTAKRIAKACWRPIAYGVRLPFRLYKSYRPRNEPHPMAADLPPLTFAEALEMMPLASSLVEAEVIYHRAAGHCLPRQRKKLEQLLLNAEKHFGKAADCISDVVGSSLDVDHIIFSHVADEGYETPLSQAEPRPLDEEVGSDAPADW